MYQTTQSANKENPAEYQADNLHIRDNHKCAHKFVREGRRIRCTLCNIGYVDSPLDPMPIDELNDFFQDPKNIEYFSNHNT